MRLVVINRDPKRPILRQQPSDNLQPIPHQRQPEGMLQSVVIMGEGTASVVRRVDENALDLAGKLLFERFEGQQVVPEDEAVVEQVMIGNPMRRDAGLLSVLQQNARLQLWPVFLPNPGQFELSLVGHRTCLLSFNNHFKAKLRALASMQ